MDFPISLDLLFEDDLASIRRFRSLVVLTWRDTPTVARMAPTTRALTTTLRQLGGEVVLCASMAGGRALPDNETRAVLQAGIERMGSMRGVVNIIRGSGFQAAALRGFLTGFTLVTRQKHPVSFVASEAEAATFIARHWPPAAAPAPDRAALAKALEETRDVPVPT